MTSGDSPAAPVQNTKDIICVLQDEIMKNIQEYITKPYNVKQILKRTLCWTCHRYTRKTRGIAVYLRAMDDVYFSEIDIRLIL